jgi:hypothetical protein
MEKFIADLRRKSDKRSSLSCWMIIVIT